MLIARKILFPLPVVFRYSFLCSFQSSLYFSSPLDSPSVVFPSFLLFLPRSLQGAFFTFILSSHHCRSYFCNYITVHNGLLFVNFPCLLLDIYYEVGLSNLLEDFALLFCIFS